MKYNLLKSILIYATIIPICILIYYFDLFRLFSGSFLSIFATILVIIVFAIALKVVGIKGKTPHHIDNDDL